jgi:hypothetical protein
VLQPRPSRGFNTNIGTQIAIMKGREAFLPGKRNLIILPSAPRSSGLTNSLWAGSGQSVTVCRTPAPESCRGTAVYLRGLDFRDGEEKAFFPPLAYDPSTLPAGMAPDGEMPVIFALVVGSMDAKLVYVPPDHTACDILSGGMAPDGGKMAGWRRMVACP